jgi:protein-tyrosine phosphatase
MLSARVDRLRATALAAALALTACGGTPPPDQRAVPARLPEPERESSRRLPLDGAHNFRDLGGYATADGRRVKWGVLYRSDALADLSDADLAYLERLDLKRVVDFRSRLERERDPDRIPAAAGLDVVLRPIQGDALDPAELRERLMSGDGSADDWKQLLIEANRAFVRDFGEVYAGFLRDLADAAELPVLFHCTAGKDRTGFAAAVALLAAGVPRETVMRDYLLTNHFSADHTERVLTVLRIFSLFRTQPDAVRPLFEARREYLQAAFDTIDAEFGGTDAWLRQGLGADDALLMRLRDNLLDPEHLPPDIR